MGGSIAIILLGWSALVSMLALFIMGSDKWQARTNKDRVPEGLLFFLAILGGALGVYGGMFLFRHKTKKVYFLLGIPLLFFQQLLLVFGYFPEVRATLESLL
jgi:uncharacterized membrane protein YsdA (DUF1294 family)